MVSRRIAKISRLMRLLCLVLIVATPSTVALIWWKLDFLLRELPGMSQVPIHPELIGPGTKLLGFAVHMIPAGIAVYGFDQLRRLFELYMDGEIFSLNCVSRLRSFAHALLVYGIASPIALALISVIVTMNNPPGERALSITLSSNDVVTLFLGGVFIAIAQVMVEGRRLAEENSQIV